MHEAELARTACTLMSTAAVMDGQHGTVTRWNDKGVAHSYNNVVTTYKNMRTCRHVVRFFALCHIPPNFCGLPTRRFTWGILTELLEVGSASATPSLPSSLLHTANAMRVVWLGAGVTGIFFSGVGA